MLVEDIGSGYDFWHNISKIVFESNIELVTCNGINNAIKVMENLDIEEGDTLILMLDKAEPELTDNVIGFAQLLGLHKHFRVVKSEIYCMEEIFLSFKKIEEWCVLSEKDMELVKLIRDNIYQNKDYSKEYNDENNLIANYKMGKLKGGELGREKLSSSLLADLMGKSHFKVNKKTLGECWYKSCCHLPDYYKTRICRLNEDRRGDKEKLIEVIDMSIIRKAVNIEEILDIIEDNKIVLAKSNKYKEILLKELVKIDEIVNKFLEFKFLIEYNLDSNKVEGKGMYEYGEDIFQQVYFLTRDENREILEKLMEVKSNNRKIVKF